LILQLSAGKIISEKKTEFSLLLRVKGMKYYSAIKKVNGRTEDHHVK
jgi:hypothetical protein